MANAKIINFEKKSIKKIVEKHFGFDQLEFEIMITVMKFLYEYMEQECSHEEATLMINPKASIAALFEGDQDRFAYAFIELVKYWELENISEEDVRIGNEFETFNTVADLCRFLERKIKESA